MSTIGNASPGTGLEPPGAAIGAAAAIGAPEGALRVRMEQRSERSLAAEEAAGRRLALKGRIVALVAIAFVNFLTLPFPQSLYYEAMLLLFLVSGLARYGLERLGFFRWWFPYAQVVIDAVLLAAVLVLPNPLGGMEQPLQLELRFSNFTYFYILLVELAFSYQPKLVVWGGVACSLVWGATVALIASLADTDIADVARLVYDPTIPQIASPTFVDLRAPFVNVMVFLTVSMLMAAVVARSRHLVLRQSTLERERVNLARHFPPAIVDRLAAQDRTTLADTREQRAAIMFADLVGFTKWAEPHPPHDVIVMLRAVHARLEDEVFRHHGMLDKFTGDGMMATFGTLDPEPDDIANAVACVRSIVDDFAAWNRERAQRGAPPVSISVGLHYGPVVLGNIGTERRLEFAVLGDTVNVAARLETLTRQLHASAVISMDVADALKLADPETADRLLDGFAYRGRATLKGRMHPVTVLSYG
ncbi:hypothetical protein DLJ53_19555 [Acuticoccus sediminis]|uniref:Guanylate cyclase domain-containing protein n=1 Tax=Acuticoccus sediminis TaxID=2184697 RepID=A0A8B2NNU6_9HYPH|nr:adenylate/guanylate cyclase domain-containing protein [Acuticoccus sediminis]RAH99938.1 hypothetical protein DLJ53_19555 [Acuticoccus sediminis]